VSPPAATGLVFDERFLLHRAPYEHPEHPGRLTAIRARLEKEDLFHRCQRVAAREASDAELAAIHDAGLIRAIDATTKRDFVQLDSDTYACRDSALAARLAAGGLVELTRRVLDGTLANGFALLRPPGHHAEADRAMGFCLFNNVAVAAAAARRAGARRVLIVDWDLHHGNGTQHSFWNEPDVLYFSTHQFPFYPGTGNLDEVGGPDARGRTVNVPWPPGCGDAEFLEAFDRVLLPIARVFAPDLVFVSAGFDAAAGDPLGSLRMSPAGYAALTARLQTLAAGRVLLALEGGYDLVAISRCAEACLRALLGDEDEDVAAGAVSPLADRVLRAVLRTQASFWPVLEGSVKVGGPSPPRH
jgi:histone deacetylase 6